jgi:CubicO group peptidase (beta-lactamase class C family)
MIRLGLAVATLAISTAAAQAPAMPPELDRYIADAVRTWDLPGVAIVIVKDDRVVAAKGYGVRELGKPDPVDGETIFDVASLAKSFTAAGAAVLVDAGALGWDDRVRDRLPDVRFGDPCIGEQVTLRDLLSHRTGLEPANSTFRFLGFDRGRLLRAVEYLQPRAPFRTGMVYSNVLYTVAGEMTAAAAGTSWPELIRRRVVEPAGMTSTAVGVRPSGPNVASPHATIEGKQQPIRPFDFGMVAPASSIFTNAVDLARWLRLQLGDGSIDGRQVISREAMIEMHSPQTIIATTPEMRSARLVEFFAAYGLGWQVMDYRGEPMLWHSGNADGMPSYMALLPRQKLGVAVLINSWASGFLHGALASKILDTYLGAPPRDWSAETRERYLSALEEQERAKQALAARTAAAPAPARPLGDLAGTYRAKLWGDLTVALVDDELVLRTGDTERAALRPLEDGTFHVVWTDPVLRDVYYDTTVRITPAADGTAARLDMTLVRDDIEAIRVP